MEFASCVLYYKNFEKDLDTWKQGVPADWEVEEEAAEVSVLEVEMEAWEGAARKLSCTHLSVKCFPEENPFALLSSVRHC